MRIDELQVGQRASYRRTIGDDDVRSFAQITGDDNPVHLDEAVAAQSRFGSRIVHGMLTAGLISAALAKVLPGPGTIYLEQSLRFTKPVRIGETIDVELRVLETNVPRQRARIQTDCRNADGELVVTGEATVMVPG